MKHAAAAPLGRIVALRIMLFAALAMLGHRLEVVLGDATTAHERKAHLAVADRRAADVHGW